jgi:hypothetical protein
MSVINAQRFAKFAIHEDTEEDTITMRPASTALFCIDSSDRYASFQDDAAGTQSPYSFNIVKNQALLNGFFKRIALTEIVFPYYVPNINTRTDMIQVTSTGNGTVTATIGALGFYTPPQLASTLQTILRTATLNNLLTVTYNDGRFVILTNAADTISFARGNYGGLGSRINQFQLFDLLNMGPQNTNAATLQTTGVTRCRYTEYIDIVSSQLTYNQKLKDASSDKIVRDVLARVYVETEDNLIQPYWNGTTEVISRTDIPGTYPFTINRKFPMPKQIRWDDTQPLGNVSFEVYDDKGELLSSHLGAQFPDYTMPDWRFSLLVSEN